jgi:hypothetical protein
MTLPGFDFGVEAGQTIVIYVAPPDLRPVPAIRMRVRPAASNT